MVLYLYTGNVFMLISMTNMFGIGILSYDSTIRTMDKVVHANTE